MTTSTPKPAIILIVGPDVEANTTLGRLIVAHDPQSHIGPYAQLLLADDMAADLFFRLGGTNDENLPLEELFIPSMLDADEMPVSLDELSTILSTTLIAYYGLVPFGTYLNFMFEHYEAAPLTYIFLAQHPELTTAMIARFPDRVWIVHLDKTSTMPQENFPSAARTILFAGEPSPAFVSELFTPLAGL